MYSSLFIIITGIVIIDFFIERTLDWLNATSARSLPPEELADVYDSEKYARAQRYKKVTGRFSLLTSAISFVAIMLMLFLGGFAWADQLARTIVVHPIAITLIFFAILMLASSVVNLPFSIYGTFVIEQKFGFNRTTPKTFVLDKLKGLLLGGIIGGGLLALVTWLYFSTGQWFWILAWSAISAFSIFMAMFYSNLIVPLFNKQTPLPAGELRDAIESYCARNKFALTNIFVIDGSKRSSKANAYFTGLGHKKRIVLYDTLIQQLSTDEIVAVLAHETGHYKKKHTLSGMVLSILETGLTLYILDLLVMDARLSLALGAQEAAFHLGLVTFGILYSPISLLLGLGGNMLSRKNEFEADRFAAETSGAEHLISGLKKMASEHLSNLTPHPWYVFFHYSHPPLLARVRHLSKWRRN